MYLSYYKEANITPKAFASVVNKQTQTTYGTKVAIAQMQKFTIIKLKKLLRIWANLQKCKTSTHHASYCTCAELY